MSSLGDKYMIKVIPQLNKILDERNLTQLAFSNSIGISQSVINRFDKNGQYRIEYLFIISRALNLRIEDLFEVIEE